MRYQLIARGTLTMIKTIKRLAKHHNIKIKDATLILIKARFDYNLAKQIIKEIKYKIVV